MSYKENYAFWCTANLPEEIKQELRSFESDEEELKSRFGSELQFGTAGMRGVMGVGSNRLNRYTVRRAAQGMAAWLKSTDLPQRAAIGYDSRHNSQLFAEICAIAFAEAGIFVYLFDRLAPTPMLSYAVRELDCGCGIVVSASHNSGEYNGVKCYGPDGCQMTDEPASEVTRMISQIPYFVPESKSFQEFVEQIQISYIDQALWENYYRTVIAESVNPEIFNSADLRVVYTPLCGTGNEPVREVLGRLGVDVTVVACQEHPDGDFRTCEYPNPETDEALRESYKTATTVPCDLILGTDPDCDRLTVAVPEGDGFRKLTGNELGCLLLEYILRARTACGNIPEQAIAIRSIVSTPLADRIANRYGVTMRAVLTGFKYIGGEILSLEMSGQEDRFVFGFEESCGYLKGTYARDKDAVVASMLVCEVAAELKIAGKTILDAVNDMYRAYGYYLSYIQSVELEGSDAMEKAAMIMTDLRDNIPASIGGAMVTTVRDYKSAEEKNIATGELTEILLPKSNVLEFVLGEKGSVIIRLSGTEPKVKFYYTVVGESRGEAQTLLTAITEQVSKLF